MYHDQERIVLGMQDWSKNPKQLIHSICGIKGFKTQLRCTEQKKAMTKSNFCSDYVPAYTLKYLTRNREFFSNIVTSM